MQTQTAIQSLPEKVNAYERELIFEAMKQAAGSITNAAIMLGVSHQALGYIVDQRHPELRVKPKQSRKS